MGRGQLAEFYEIMPSGHAKLISLFTSRCLRARPGRPGGQENLIPWSRESTSSVIVGVRFHCFLSMSPRMNSVVPGQLRVMSRLLVASRVIVLCSSSRSRSPSTARRAATFAILMAIL
jgi:hypothetical protein